MTFLRYERIFPGCAEQHLRYGNTLLGTRKKVTEVKKFQRRDFLILMRFLLWSKAVLKCCEGGVHTLHGAKGGIDGDHEVDRKWKQIQKLHIFSYLGPFYGILPSGARVGRLKSQNASEKHVFGSLAVSGMAKHRP